MTGVVLYPDDRLTQRATEVVHFDEALEIVADDMHRIMRAQRGVGLAGPQAGYPWRVVALEHWRTIVNPRIVAHSEASSVDEERCLSVPGASVQVRRWDWVEVEACDVDGTPFCCRFTGFQARVIQHEIDHIDGVLMLDRVPRAQAKRALRRAGLWRKETA